MWWKLLEIKVNSIKRVSKLILKSFLLILYTVFLLSLILGARILGIMTLIPDEASKPCYLGYYAHCSFTPYSTLILFIMAIIGIILLMKFIKYIRNTYDKVIENNSKIRNFVLN